MQPTKQVVSNSPKIESTAILDLTQNKNMATYITVMLHMPPTILEH